MNQLFLNGYNDAQVGEYMRSGDELYYQGYILSQFGNFDGAEDAFQGMLSTDNWADKFFSEFD